MEMADEKDGVDGVASQGNLTAENFYDENGSKVLELNRKIEVLEREKRRLVDENDEIKERIQSLTAESQGMKREEVSLKKKLAEMEKTIERSKEGEKVSEAIAARAAVLESEVSRLQHDLISSMNEVEEANADIAELKKLLGEKGEKVGKLEREVEDLKKEKAETEKNVRELERKVGILEMREIEEKSKKVRLGEETRDKIGEKEREVNAFRKRVEDLESVIIKSGLELEKWVKEKLNVEEALRESEEKTNGLGLMVVQLQKEVEDAEKVIWGLKENAVESINGTANEVKAALGGGSYGLNALMLHWPAVAGSTGAILAAAAVVYVWYGRRN